MADDLAPRPPALEAGTRAALDEFTGLMERLSREGVPQAAGALPLEAAKAHHPGWLALFHYLEHVVHNWPVDMAAGVANRRVGMRCTCCLAGARQIMTLLPSRHCSVEARLLLESIFGFMRQSLDGLEGSGRQPAARSVPPPAWLVAQAQPAGASERSAFEDTLLRSLLGVLCALGMLAHKCETLETSCAGRLLVQHLLGTAPPYCLALLRALRRSAWPAALRNDLFEGAARVMSFRLASVTASVAPSWQRGPGGGHLTAEGL